MTGRRRRTPSEAELALWAKVVESVAPLPGRARPSAPAAPEPAASPSEPPPTETAPAALVRRPVERPPIPLAPLESRFRRRLARGVVEIDARIDLHGLRQEDAHRRLVGFLTGAQARGHRIVLVITGKGASHDPHAERGVLRRNVPMWLGMPDVRSIVVGFESADPVHGGVGALYVRIRRAGRR